MLVGREIDDRDLKNEFRPVIYISYNQDGTTA